MRISKSLIPVVAVLSMLMTGCTSDIDFDVIPAYPVFIDLGNAGLWNTYGVAGQGTCRYFSMQRHEPTGFAYSQMSRTGFGGVMLVGSGYTTEDGFTIPYAYDMACPVERRSDVVVYFDDNTMEAVCPVCKSHYEVYWGSGAPISGPAKSMQVGMKPHQCQRQQYGGYIVRW